MSEPTVELEDALARSLADATARLEFERQFLESVVHMVVYGKSADAGDAKDFVTTPLEFEGVKCLPLFFSVARANAFIAELKDPPHRYIPARIAVRDAIKMFSGSNFLIVGDKARQLLPAQAISAMLAAEGKPPPPAAATGWKAKAAKWFRKS